MPDKDVDQLITDGERYRKNAEDALDQTVDSEDELYIWQNQVEVCDTFLADTEELAAESDELAELREDIRDLKDELEHKIIEWSAQQAGEEVPEEPPDEIVAQEFVEFADEFLRDIDEAIETEITDIDQIEQWEAPRDMVNSFLADSEPYEDDHPELAEVRERVRERKRVLDHRIQTFISEWREEDMEEA